MNNTDKLDDIRRRLRRIETRLGIIQRVNIITFERVTGRAFPSSWIVHDDEQGLLGDEDAISDKAGLPERRLHDARHTAATVPSSPCRRQPRWLLWVGLTPR
jgi:hypothetical protein